MARTRGTLALSGALVALALVISGCGNKDFPNKPRVPNTLQVSAYVTDQSVRVDPTSFGAGIAAFSIANQSQDDIQFTLDGPTHVSGNPIPAGGTGTVKSDLKEGDYAVTAGTSSLAQPARLTVGPERPSAQNHLLLP